MCMILDANMFGAFLQKTEDMKPIHEWLNQKNGRLLYSNYEKIRKEVDSNKRMKEFLLLRRRRSSIVKLIEKDDVQRSIEEIKGRHELKSDDIHVLGLAKASGTKLLCSQDKKLHKDFKKVVNGSIYQNKGHKSLLTYDACP